MRYQFTKCLCIFGLLLSQNIMFGQCEITSIGLSNVYCNDNATPVDTLDDFIIFTIQPSGSSVSSFYSISVSSGTLNSNSGQFGIPKVLFLNDGSAGAGNIVLTIKDMLDTLCVADTLVVDPGVCSSLCEINQIGLVDLECNDNGSLSNPYDDFISFNVTPTGNNVDSMFFIEVSNGSVNPVFGTYGMQSSHIMQAGSSGNGDFYLTISDNSDTNCLFDTLITDPGSCSPNCELLAIHLDSITCNNNNTPAIPEDDFIEFILNPEGYNISASYNILVSEGTVTPDSAFYGSPASFQLNPGSADFGDIMLSIADSGVPNCSLDTILINPGTCSPDCEIFDSGLSTVLCNNNNTDSTGIDDYISFNLNPVGSSNNGNFYLVTVSPGSVVPSVGVFGQSSSFLMQFGSAGGGNVSITIKDMTDISCLITTVLEDPGPCSSLCDITDPQFDNLICNNNGTNNDPTDDFLEFSLDPIGIELLNGYTLSIDTGSVFPEFGYYDTLSYFSLFSGSAEYDSFALHIEDSLVSNCFFDLTIVSPGSCSPKCNIVDAQLDSLHCDNNGTPSDDSDDRIKFNMSPYGYNLNKNYSVIVSSGSIMPNMGAFENEQQFSMQEGSAGAGNVFVKIKDIFDQTCPLDVLITDPGTCSPDCEIIEVQLADIQCNHNNTLSDYTDDYISFSLTPNGFNIDSLYTLEVSQGEIEPNTGVFGETTDFELQMGSAGSGDVTVTLYNSTDSLCFIQLIISDPGSCSPVCSITDLDMADLMCHDNNTPHDTLDDYFSFSLTPEGFNIGSKYLIEISEGGIFPDTGYFYQTTIFELLSGSAGSGDKVITVTDFEDQNCIAQMLIHDPGHCSDICLITESNLSEIECHDNNTNSDASDDFINFSLKPLGGNTAGSYSISSDIGEVTPNTGIFGEQMYFALENGSAGTENRMISIKDLVDTNCVLTFELENPGSCSPECEILDFGLENVICNDNNTDADSSDDYISFQINPSGFNTGNIFQISASEGLLQPGEGYFDSLQTFKMNAGSAGLGSFELTISSALDSMCNLNLLVEDPGTCSPKCEITDVVVGTVTCKNNNTSSDDSDDFIHFSMNVEGFNLEGSFLVFSSTGEITPSLLEFNGAQEFDLAAGSAGAGDFEITIVNLIEDECIFSLLVANPGSCSEVCQINNTFVENLHCNNNNTNDDPTDDFISFAINPMGFNVSDSFYLTTLNWGVSPDVGFYGVPGTYALSPGSAGTGINLLRIVDAEDSLCFKNVLLTNPGTCSEACNIINAQLENILCNDNETPTDSLDDYISFELNPSGYNLEGEYLLFAMNGIVMPSSGSYNEVSAFSLQNGSAGNDNVSILIIDAADNNCEIMIDIDDPGSCSDLSASLDYSFKNRIKCFPNPVYETVYLDGVPLNSQIEIRNIFGKLIYTVIAESPKVGIELSNWNSGLYMLSVFHGQERLFTEKLVKH